jgi:glycine betaine/proline transport system substrate-binding protein
LRPAPGQDMCPMTRPIRTRPARLCALLLALFALAGAPAAEAQSITVLDNAQDGAAGASAAPLCGTRPISIARLPWPSAAILAEIHARILSREFGCTTQVLAGDLNGSVSAMASSGQPAIVPEMWAMRVLGTWNQAIEAQTARQAGASFDSSVFEGWFAPAYAVAADPALGAVATLAEASALAEGGAGLRFISCPPDWGCAIVNRNLVAALGLGDSIEIVTPANRFEMDAVIAEGISRREPFLFYYWQPNALLAQLDFTALDMGSFEVEAAQCLARVTCINLQPSAFAPETVVNGVAEWVFADAGPVARYLQRAQMPLPEMNELLAQMNEPGATPEAVADRFLAEREEIWRPWAAQP